jgi:hypothetical protein
MNGVVAAISATMTAPDSGPHLALLQQLLQAAVGQLQKVQNPGPPPGAGGPPGGMPPGGAPPGGMPPGGGTNIGQLMGGAPSGPSAGVGGGPSPSGISADDMRRMVASNAGTPG